MNVTEAVVRDLWVLVQAGEASAESRAIVEDWLARHPALATELANADALPPLAPVPAPAPGSERAALERTRALLARRTWSLAAGIFFSALPCTFVFGSHGLEYLMLRDQPLLSSVSLAIGVAAWIVFSHASGRLKPAGF